jgi:hypothetical protein
MRAGIVRVGLISWIHSLAYQCSSRAELVSFGSRDERKRGGDWRDIRHRGRCDQDLRNADEVVGQRQLETTSSCFSQSPLPLGEVGVSAPGEGCSR